MTRHDREFCADLEEPPGCLSVPVGKAAVRLVAEELQIRSLETNLGDWVADQALAAFRDQGAQVAFLNSGGLRLNQDIPEGSNVTRQHLKELFAYPSPLYLIRIDGATLQQVVDHALEGWPGEGRWLQVAGFAWRHHTNERRTDGLTLLTPEGPRPVRPDETILAVVNNFLIDPGIGDQDGYTMLSKGQVVATGGEPPDLVGIVEQALRQSGEAGIAPRVEGRICSLPGQQAGPCLAVTSGE